MNSIRLFLTVLFATLLSVAYAMPYRTNSTNDDEDTYSAHVVDASTGEALPYVHVYVSQGVGTMTNMEGDFTVKTTPESTLRLSFVGYETLTIQASQLPRIVKLKPLTHTLFEVEVLPVTTILTKTRDRLYKEYSKKKKTTGKYFYRQQTTTNNKELVEAFLEAKDVVNLRELTFLSGRHGRHTDAGLRRPLIANMNFHHPLELGPMTNEIRYWRGMYQPLSLAANNSFWNRIYEYACTTIFEESTGRKTYCVTMTSKDSVPQRPIMTGKLYIDASTYELLRYEGRVEGMMLDVSKDFVRITAPIQLDLHINYRHTNKCTEVESISYKLESGDFKSSALLFNVDALDLGNKKKNKIEGIKVGENMLASLDESQFETILDQNAGIVKRTSEEDETANLGISGIDDVHITQYNITKSVDPKRWQLVLPDTRVGNLANRLAKMGQIIPQEKVYIHMDNTTYFVGDTIWYSAYVSRTSDDSPSNISGVMYVELYGQDGYLLERQTIDLKDGRGCGNFEIKSDYYGGFYELRAYTRWQLNWGAYEKSIAKENEYWFMNEEMLHNYYRDYEKLYSRVFPVYDAPKVKGRYDTGMTLRPKRQYFKNDPDPRKLTLTFYPEGGELIEGVENNVAFEAVYSDGEYVEGTLTQGSGKNVKTIAKAVHRGRGSFTFIPSDDSDREYTFTTNTGVKVSAKLPKVERDGVALSVQRVDSLWSISVRSVGESVADTLGVTVMHEGRIRCFWTITDEHATLSIADSLLECGVNQVTVFDGDGRQMADRLFFVSRAGMGESPFRITGIKEQYAPYEKIQLGVSRRTVSPLSPLTLSLAVHDDERMDQLFDNASIQAEMLLSSEIRGFVPNPGWYFEADDAEHRKALDLLMMTQGWRRFKWRDMAVRGEWDLTEPDERTPIVVGTVYNYDPMYFYNVEYWQGKPDLGAGSADADGVTPLDEGGDTEMDREARELAEAAKMMESKKAKSDPPTWKNVRLEEIRLGETRVNKRVKKESVVVHAEFVPVHSVDDEVEALEALVVETTLKDGQFRFALPKCYTDAVFFVAASDSAKWKEGHRYEWVQSMPGMNDEYITKRRFQVPCAEYSIRINQPYPRWVKPYSYYQMHIDEDNVPELGALLMSDGTRRIREVKVRARRSGMRRFQDSIPAFQIDAYDAYNYCLDAGMIGADAWSVMRSFVGDYGLEIPYTFDIFGNKDYHFEIRYGLDGVRRATNGLTIDEDSIYMRSNLKSVSDKGYLTTTEVDYYNHLQRIERYVLYTDYEPRQMGSVRYKGTNLPHSIIVPYRYVDDSRRKYYRDRRYVLPGISVPAEFYSPDYSQRTAGSAPEDYRRTLYWNPNLTLSSEGEATVTFYNNSSDSQISVSAEGW